MNERIKELMIQSGAYSYYDIDENIEGDKTPMIKFAELIVKECATFADKCRDMELSFPGDYIKGMFGVK